MTLARVNRTVESPDLGKEDVDLAVKSASDAFEEWSSWSAEKGLNVSINLADKIQENAGLLAEAETRDNGKPIGLSTTVDIPRAEKKSEILCICD